MGTRAVASGIAIGLLLSLAACGPGAEPVATATAAPTVTPTPTPTPTVPPPTLNADGTALQNLDYFTYVLRQLLDEKPRSQGRVIIDLLVEAGFKKKDMEITADLTPIGDEVDSRQFAVRINGTCLIGQSGRSGFNTIAVTLLATNRCLVGDTRAIDW